MPAPIQSRSASDLTIQDPQIDNSTILFAPSCLCFLRPLGFFDFLGDNAIHALYTLNTIMTSSPSKSSAVPPQQALHSPRGAGRLRQMKSAHNLSANYNNGPSLISQQRQQQQQQQQQLQPGSRIPSNARIPAMPALPHRIPSPQKHDSPSKQSRPRANSDLAPSSHTTPAPSPSRRVAPKTPVNAKEELEGLIRNGPKGDLSLALQNLRHWILCDGMDADSDGMVNKHQLFISVGDPAYPSSSPTSASTSG